MWSRESTRPISACSRAMRRDGGWPSTSSSARSAARRADAKRSASSRPSTPGEQPEIVRGARPPRGRWRRSVPRKRHATAPQTAKSVKMIERAAPPAPSAPSGSTPSNAASQTMQPDRWRSRRPRRAARPTRERAAESSRAGLFAPRRERLGVYAGAGVLAQHRQVFAQVGARGELRDRLLARAHGRGLSRRLQPGRQRLLAHPGARGAQQLEERRRPEQIEIARVQVLVVEEAIAGLAARARPIGRPAARARARRTRRRGRGARARSARVRAAPPIQK